MSRAPDDRIRVLIVGYRKFSELINAVMPEFVDQAEITIIESVASANVEIENLVAHHRPDVVASAGANAAYLAATLSVPVVSQPVTDTDIIEALVKARRVSRRVHLFSYQAETALVRRLLLSLPELLDMDLIHHAYSTSDEASQKLVLALAEERAEVVVGPSYTCHMAEQRDIPAILVYSKESARDLLRNAVDSGRAWLASRSAGGRGTEQLQFVIRSARMERVAALAQTYARSGGAVLLEGESGTGKEHIAREIHRHSEYCQGPLVAVNCGSIPNELFESELFGYVEGAFTSSRRGGRVGLVEQANGGALYLDEVGEMPPQQQVKLLRVLQDKRVRPVGSNREIELDFKVIAATNRDLRDAVLDGRFRDDLYYRLNVFSLKIPPLRERRDDIPAIARYYIGDYARQYGVAIDPASLYDSVSNEFEAYAWPGNVRELQNFAERLVVNCVEGGIGAIEAGRLRDILPELFTPRGAADSERGLLKAQEETAILDAMARFHNNKGRVARHLGISPTTLWRRLRDMEQGSSAHPGDNGISSGTQSG